MGVDPRLRRPKQPGNGGKSGLAESRPIGMEIMRSSMCNMKKTKQNRIFESMKMDEVKELIVDLSTFVAVIPLDKQGLEMLSVNKKGEVFKIKSSKAAKRDIDIVPRTVRGEESIASSMVSVVEQISSDIGWDRVRNCADDFSSFSIVHDNELRQSVLDVRVPPAFPNEAPTCTSSDLPQLRLELDWSEAGKRNLRTVFEAFEGEVEVFLPVWEKLSQLDEACCVIDPDRPTGKDLHRRIVVNREVSVQVTVDPETLHDCPKLNFLGADEQVEFLRRNYERNIASYDPNDNLAESLERLLGIELPGPDVASDGEYLVDCCICYSHVLDGETPIKSCDGAAGGGRCGQRFHERCLYSYMVQTTDKQIYLGVIAGKCLGCGSRISCKDLSHR